MKTKIRREYYTGRSIKNKIIAITIIMAIVWVILLCVDLTTAKHTINTKFCNGTWTSTNLVDSSKTVDNIKEQLKSDIKKYAPEIAVLSKQNKKVDDTLVCGFRTADVVMQVKSDILRITRLSLDDFFIITNEHTNKFELKWVDRTTGNINRVCMADNYYTIGNITVGRGKK